MILIISAKEDVHSHAVQAELDAEGIEWTLVDLREFPKQSDLALRFGEDRQRTWRFGTKTVDLDDVTAVWWRRPQPFEFDPSVSCPNARNFAYRECDEAIQGLWSTLDARWINVPHLDEQASHKVWQLDVAERLGMRIPRTIVTNDPDAALSFVRNEGTNGTIYKAFQGSIETWRETRLLRDGEQDQLDMVRHAPVIFQEYISSSIDLRVTVVGDQIFPAAIHSGDGAYEVDFRMDMHSCRIEPYLLPDNVERQLRTFVTELGLTYGAVDYRVAANGELVFLEVNPAGQWLFIEDETGQPISRAMARQLSATHRGIRCLNP